jgi:hypothetical protein
MGNSRTTYKTRSADQDVARLKHVARPKKPARENLPRKSLSTISCGKSELRLTCPMNNPALPHGLDRALPSRRLPTPWEKAGEKSFPAKTPRNPLKVSIRTRESKEIQANPRLKSGGVRNETATRQENPKPSGLTDVMGPPPRRSARSVQRQGALATAQAGAS